MTEEYKDAAARKALEWVKNDMRIGLGTGSTVDIFIKALAEKIKQDDLNITAISSSFSTSLLSRQLNINLCSSNDISAFDLYIDGADEVNPQKNMIKGNGGSMVQEKVLSMCADSFIIIVDDSKLVSSLGQKFPVPIEVVPMAMSYVSKQVMVLGGTPTLRQAVRKSGPVITDQGNYILDASFPENADFIDLDSKLNNIPGVLGHGIFIDLADVVVSGGKNGVQILE